MRYCCLSVMTFILSSTLCLTARAQNTGPTRILVLNPETKLLSQARLKKLGQQLRDLVRRYPDVSLVKGPGLDLRLLRIRARCRHSRPSCLAAMGRLAHADRVLHTSINALPGRYLVHMKLVEVASRRLLDSSRQPCRRKLEDVRNALWKAWVAIQGPLVRSQLKVSANVTGAVVMLDGRPVGRTPLVVTRELSRGDHVVEVRHPGWASVRKVVRVKGGEGITLNVGLAKLVAVEKPPEAVVQKPTAGKKLAGGKEEGTPEAVGRQSPAPAAAATGSTGSTEPGVPPAQKLARRPSLVQRRPPGKSAAGERTTKPDNFTPPPPAGRVQEVPVEEPPGGPALPATSQAPGSRWYTSWWFWSIVGAAVAAGATTGIVLGLGSGESIPAGKGRVTLTF